MASREQIKSRLVSLEIDLDMARDAFNNSEVGDNRAMEKAVTKSLHIQAQMLHLVGQLCDAS